MNNRTEPQDAEGPAIDADATPAASPGILEAAAQGTLVLFDPATKLAHTLNPSAATIWQLCDGETPLDAIADAVSRSFAVPAQIAHESVAATVRQLLDNGVLTVTAADPPADHTLPDEATQRRDDIDLVTVRLRAAGRTICFETSSSEALDVLTWLFAPLLALGAPAPDDRDTVVRIDATPQGSRTVFDVRSPGDERPSRAASLQALVNVLVTVVNRVVSEREDAYPVLHAAAAVVDGRIVALPAVAGSGKSTTVAALVASGAAYLTDEALGVRAGSRHVVAYPKRLALKRGSWAPLGDPRPELPPVLAGAVGPTATRHLDPRQLDADALRDAVEPGPLDVVVFPRYEAGATCALERQEPLDALLTLMANTFNLARAGQSALDTLTELAHDTPCYRLVHGDVTAACAAIRSLR